MWITSVKIDGAAIPLDETLADLVIRHGRADVDDGTTASTVQLTLRDVTRAYTRAFTVGVPLLIRMGESGEPDAPRFTGTVTDATLDDDLLTLIAAGPVSTLARYEVGAVAWPAETWSQRVARVFAEAGVSSLLLMLVDPTFDPLLVARAVADPVSLYDYLSTLATDVGAAVVDTPDGHVLVQQISARATTDAGATTWAQVPTATTWADASCSWAEATSLHAIDPDVYPDLGGILAVDPADVLFVPTWLQTLDLENETTVGYGDNLSVTVTEPASVTKFGEYPGALTTEISGVADATTRGNQRVFRRAFPRWSIAGATLLGGFFCFVGERVRLVGFPPPSPAGQWDGILEGWTDTIRGDEWTVDLALSDATYSGLALTWESTPPALDWAEVDPACDWADATSIDALIPF